MSSGGGGYSSSSHVFCIYREEVANFQFFGGWSRFFILAGAILNDGKDHRSSANGVKFFALNIVK